MGAEVTQPLCLQLLGVFSSDLLNRWQSPRDK